MPKGYTKRIQALRENYMSHRVEMDTLDVYYVTQGFKATEDQPWQIQKAVAMRTVYENKPIFIQDHEFLVGGVAFKPRAGILSPDSACSVIGKELDTISARKYDPFYLSKEDKKSFMGEVAPYWRDKCVPDRWNAMIPEDVRTMRNGGMLYVDKKFVRGYGENTPGWRILLVKGIVGVKKEVEGKLAALDDARGEDVLKQIIFYKFLTTLAEGIIASASCHADLAEEMAEKEADEKRRAELLKIAGASRNAPADLPRNLYEALQSMFTYELCIFMEQNVSSYNLGRMDQYLIQYHEKDLADGTMAQDETQELMGCFWTKISEVRLFRDGESAAFSVGYNMMVQVYVGGIDQHGNDAVNDLSYVTTQVAQDTALKEPNMMVRYSISKNPDSFSRRAAECIRMGRTIPAVYHNDVGIKTPFNKGIPTSQVRDQAPCGCVETNLEGRLKSYTDIGEISMGGVVDMIMNNGRSRKTGEQTSTRTGDPRDFKTLGDSMVAVKKRIGHSVHIVATMNLYLDYLSENYRPVLVLSLTYLNCMVVGKDYANGGAEFNVGNGINTIGQVDIINSVVDTKYLVFDEKKISMDELCRALDVGLEGYEHIHRMCMDAPKYSNDDPKADSCVGEIYNHLVDQVEQYDSPFGELTAGMLPVSDNVPIGQGVGALLSGRKVWTSLADDIGVTGGTNINGTTALLKSISNLPHARFTQRVQMNLKIDPKLLEGEHGLNSMTVLLKTQCILDVYHIQYNVTNPEILMDTQKNPGDHKDLPVRVAGYTVFSIELGKDIQDDIIQRTEIENWG